MAAIVTQSFESYSNGELPGSSGWNGGSTSLYYYVTDAKAKAGTKSLVAHSSGDRTIDTPIRSVLLSGTQVLYFYPTNVASWGTGYGTELRFSDPDTGAQLDVKMLQDKTVEVGWGGVYGDAGDFIEDTWNSIKIEWRNSPDYKARISLNKGTFTDWKAGSGNWTSGFNKFRIDHNCLVAEGIYFDAFQEDYLPETQTTTRTSRGRIKKTSPINSSIKAHLHHLTTVLNNQTTKSKIKTLAVSKLGSIKALITWRGKRARIKRAGETNLITSQGRILTLGNDKLLSIRVKIGPFTKDVLSNIRGRLKQIDLTNLYQSRAWIKRINYTLQTLRGRINKLGVSNLESIKGRLKQIDFTNVETSRGRIKQINLSSKETSQGKIKQSGIIRKETSKGRVKQLDVVNLSTKKGRLLRKESTLILIQARIKQLWAGLLSIRAAIFNTNINLGLIRGRIFKEGAQLLSIRGRIKQLAVSNSLQSQGKIRVLENRNLSSRSKIIFLAIQYYISSKARILTIVSALSSLRGRLKKGFIFNTTKKGRIKIIDILNRFQSRGKILRIEDRKLQSRARIKKLEGSLLISRGRVKIIDILSTLSSKARIKIINLSKFLTSRGKIKRLGNIVKSTRRGRIKQLGYTVKSTRRGRVKHTQTPRFSWGLTFENPLSWIRLAKHTFTNQFTIEAWIKTDGVATVNDVVICQRDTLGNGCPGMWLYKSNYKMGFWIRTDVTGVASVMSSTVFQAGRWYHLVGRYNGATMQLYVNGKTDGSPTSVSGNLTAGYNYLYVSKFAATGATYEWNGRIDEVRVYDRALSDTEIAEHFGGVFLDETNLAILWHLNEGTGSVAVDSSGNGNNGTITAPKWTEDSAPYFLSPRAKIEATISKKNTIRASVSKQGSELLRPRTRIKLLNNIQLSSILGRIIILDITNLFQSLARILRIENGLIQTRARIKTTTDNLIQSRGRIKITDITNLLSKLARIKEIDLSNILSSRGRIKQINLTNKFSARARIEILVSSTCAINSDLENSGVGIYALSTTLESPLIAKTFAIKSDLTYEWYRTLALNTFLEEWIYPKTFALKTDLERVGTPTIAIDVNLYPHGVEDNFAVITLLQRSDLQTVAIDSSLNLEFHGAYALMTDVIRTALNNYAINASLERETITNLAIDTDLNYGLLSTFASDSFLEKPGFGIYALTTEFESHDIHTTVALFTELQNINYSTTAIITSLESSDIKTIALISTLEKENGNTFALDIWCETFSIKTIGINSSLEIGVVSTFGLTASLEGLVPNTFALSTTLESINNYGIVAITSSLEAYNVKTIAIFADCMGTKLATYAILTSLENTLYGITAISTTLETENISTTAIISSLQWEGVKTIATTSELEGYGVMTVSSLTTLERVDNIINWALWSELEREVLVTAALYSFLEKEILITIGCITQLESKKVETCAVLTELQWAGIKTILAITSEFERESPGIFAITVTLSKHKTLGAFNQGFPLTMRL